MTPAEINEAVARKLGWVKIGRNGLENVWEKKYPEGFSSMTGLPNYSSDIKAALEIVEWLRRQRFSTKKMFLVHLSLHIPTVDDGSHNIMTNSLWWWLFMADWPMEICLAFLKLS